MRPATGFTLFLLAVSTVLLAQSMTLSNLGRVAPLAVLVPTTVLAVIKLVRDLRLGDQAEGQQAVDGSGRQLRITLWIVGLAGLVYLVGFLPAAAAFLITYLRVEAGAGWRRSLLVTAGTVAAIYVTFALLAGLRFPAGVLL